MVGTLVFQASALSIVPQKQSMATTTRQSDGDFLMKKPETTTTTTRRQCLQTVFLGSLSMVPLSTNAVMNVDAEGAQVFKAGQSLGVEDAKARFVEARRVLQELLDNYDEVQKGGGDSVRRYLGTVGTASAMYGISKVMKELQEQADDIVEYTENMNEFESALRAADTACYSANFVEFSAAKTKPEKFFEDAKRETKEMMVLMDRMAPEIGL